MISYHFCGKVANDQILDYYHNNHIECFVHTSEREGLPISIAEAESAGIPIVATNVGGTKELLDGNGVLLSAEADPEEIADALEKVLTLSIDRKTQLSSRSRQIWEKRFDAKKNAQRFLKILQSLEGSEIRHVVLITEGYPYTNEEKGFIESELKEVAKHFSVSIVARLSQVIDKEYERNAKNNLRDVLNSDTAQTIDVVPYVESWSKKDLVSSFVKIVFDKRTRFEREQIQNTKDRRFIRFFESAKFYGKAIKFYKWFIGSGILESDLLSSTLIYTYWNLQPTLGICLHRDTLHGVKVITRAHGYDYQDEQWTKSMRKPFAKTVDLHVDRIVFVCRNGMEYYLKKMAVDHDAVKYSYSYLGTKDAMEVRKDNISDASKESCLSKGDLKIVSCGALIPLKRVDKLIEALHIISVNRPDLNIEWFHFGDGPLKMQLLKQTETMLGKEI